MRSALRLVSFFIFILPYFANATEPSKSKCRSFPESTTQTAEILKPIEMLDDDKGEADPPNPRAYYIHSSSELNQYEWFVVNGQFTKKSGDQWVPITTQAGQVHPMLKSKRAVMVALPNGRIFGIDQSSQKILEDRTGLDVYHSMFTASGPVGFAGTQEIAGGKLKHISSQSGHYEPTDEAFVSYLEYLASLGVDLSETHIAPQFYLPSNLSEPLRARFKKVMPELEFIEVKPGTKAWASLEASIQDEFNRYGRSLTLRRARFVWLRLDIETRKALLDLSQKQGFDLLGLTIGKE